MANEGDVIKKSVSPRMSILYIGGLSVCIFAGNAEFDIQRRKGWIERIIRKSNDYSINNINDCVKTSRLWINYVQLGTRYAHIDQQTYDEWDKDRIKLNYTHQSHQSHQSQPHPRSQSRSRGGNHNKSSKPRHDNSRNSRNSQQSHDSREQHKEQRR